MYKKLILSLWLVVHVSLLAIFPNGYTFIREKYSAVILPYMNALSINYAWAFYAPNPETAMYLEYEVEKSNPAYETLPSETFYWPPEKEGYLDFTNTRDHTNMGYLVQFKDWIDRMFIPWACRQTANASGVTVKIVFVRVPSLDEVQSGSPIFDPDLKATERLTSGTCQGAKKL